MFSDTAPVTIKVFHNLFAHQRLPCEVVYDNVPQFIAVELKDFLVS